MGIDGSAFDWAVYDSREWLGESMMCMLSSSEAVIKRGAGHITLVFFPIVS